MIYYDIIYPQITFSPYVYLYSEAGPVWIGYAEHYQAEAPPGQGLYQWVSYTSFFLAIVPTVSFIYHPLHHAFGTPAALHKQYYKPGGYEICSTPPRSCPGDFAITGLSLTIKIVYGNTSTWHADRACCPLRAMDPIPYLQPVLPYSHTHVFGLLGPLVLALGGPSGLFGISLGNSCHMARLGFRAVILHVTDIQHTP